MIWPWTKAFGLDISDGAIKILAVNGFSMAKNSARVASWSSLALPTGLIKDGIILDKAGLASQLVKAKRQARPSLTNNYCVVSLPPTQVLTHFFTLPSDLSRLQIAEILQYEAQDFLPFSAADMYYDFLVSNHSGNKQYIFYSAAPKKIVDSLREAVVLAGLKPVVFEIEALSEERALVKKYREAEAVLVADIGANITKINVFDKLGVKLVLQLAYGGKKFTTALARGLNITEAAAEQLKAKYGLAQSGQADNATKILQAELSGLIVEVQKVIEYFSGYHHQKISQIILTGGSASLVKLSDYWQSQIGLPVSVGQPWLSLDLAGEKIQAPALINVLGLALRGQNFWTLRQGINLLKYRQ